MHLTNRLYRRDNCSFKFNVAVFNKIIFVNKSNRAHYLRFGFVAEKNPDPPVLAGVVNPPAPNDGAG